MVGQYGQGLVHGQVGLAGMNKEVGLVAEGVMELQPCQLKGANALHGALSSMGNCLFAQGADDLSLLNESEGGSLPGEPSQPQQEQTQPLPVYHPNPGESRLACQLTEEEQIRIAQRIGLIQHLPKGIFDPGSDSSEKKVKECVICMLDFEYGDSIRFLPCLHIYHVDCIDPWLMRSFTCPSCMEPVDAALLSSYEVS